MQLWQAYSVGDGGGKRSRRDAVSGFALPLSLGCDSKYACPLMWLGRLSACLLCMRL